VTLYSWEKIILNHFLTVFVVTGGNQVILRCCGAYLFDREINIRMGPSPPKGKTRDPARITAIQASAQASHRSMTSVHDPSKTRWHHGSQHR
jgi:hypothetical protein